MKFRFFVLVLLAVTGVSGVALGQPANSTATETPADRKAVIAVDKTLEVMDYSYKDGVMTVVVRSDYPQRLKVSDMFGGLSTGGAAKIPAKTVAVNSGLTEFRVRATTYEGNAAVAVSTRRAAVSLPAETDGELVEGPYMESETLLVGILSALGGLTSVLAWAYRDYHGSGGKPEQLGAK